MCLSRPVAQPVFRENYCKKREPWVAHLRMTVYKGIGKYSSSQSPAMNFDRSAVSIRLNMGYVDKINRMQNINT